MIASPQMLSFPVEGLEDRFLAPENPNKFHPPGLLNGFAELVYGTDSS